MRAVARRIGVNEGNFPAKVNRGLDADTVIHVARAYGLNIIQALIDTGFIDPSEAPEVRGAQVTEALDRMLAIAQEAKKLQTDYGLVADGSPEEGEGAPEDYEP